MKWTRYGITLSRIKEDEIELVRRWRNDPIVSKNMIYRGYITEEQQKKWFQSINNNSNSYYIIIYRDEKIGLINNKNIVTKDKSSEAGIFIWNDTYDFAPLLASVLLCEIGFYIMKGGDSYAKVLKKNKRAKEYNTIIGYDIIENKPRSRYIKIKLTKENFKARTEKLRKTIMVNTNSNGELSLELEKHDYKSGLAQLMENQYIFPLMWEDPSIKCVDFNGGKIYSGILII
jgi:UDP-4-amino-4,6-dideoxy-N-acetyl-beta-L-altrosamine N-acetyltransferase